MKLVLFHKLESSLKELRVNLEVLRLYKYLGVNEKKINFYSTKDKFIRRE